MVGILRVPPKTQRTIFGIASIAVLGVLACFASITLAGTKTGAIISIGATLGPILLYVALVSPVVFPFGLYAAVTQLDTLLNIPGFGTVTKILGVASGAALLFYMLRTKRAVQPPRVVVLWVLYYLWLTSTVWWAIDTNRSFKVLGISWSLVLLFVVTAMFRLNSKMLRAAVVAVLIGGVLAALYGIYFFHSGHNLDQTGGRLWIQTDEGSQINPDHFANSFILPAAIALVGALWSRRMLHKLLFVAALLPMLLTMALTGGRGGMLGFVAVAVYLLFKDRHRVQLAVVMAAAGVLGAIVAGPMLAYRLSTAISTGGAGRMDIWRAGLAAFKQYWLFGAGYGNFPLAYDRFYLSVFQGLDPHFDRASHNILLNAGVEAGVFGLAVLICCWIGMFRLLDPIQESDYRYPLRVALQAATVGLFIAGLFVDMMISKYVWMAFMLTVMTYNAGPVYVSSLERRRVEMEVAAASSA